MPLFRRRAKRPPPVWAGPLSGSDVARLVGLVEDDFRRRGLRAAYDGEAIHADGGTYGLANLAQVCHPRPVAAWPAIVAAHFDSLGDLAWEPPARLDDATRARLRVRLQDPEYLLHGAEETGAAAVRPVADGLVEALVVDFPGSIAYLKAADIDAWGEDRDALFAEGRARLRAAVPEEPLGAEAFVGGVLGIETADTATATHALWLDELLGVEISSRGAFVAVPTRHIVLARLLEDAGVIEDTPGMIASAHRMHSDGPGSIVPDLFWWRPGAPWVRVRTEFEDAATRIFPPDELVEILNELAEEEPSG